MAGDDVYLLSDPDLVIDVFLTHARDVMKGRGLQAAKALLGNGLLTSEGEFHLRQRRLAQPAFHRQRIAAYADERADSVPTGTARLLELARCLAGDPRLLLLDEPSSGLDETETDAFGELLEDLAGEGRAILMVEHDMDLVMGVCDTIHVLDFGRVIASGSPALVRRDPAVQRAYLGYAEDGPGDPGEPVTQEIPAVAR